jgi:type VI protein secretion system component Hcp
MADQYNNEVFMRLVDMNDKPILAECRTEVTTDGDDLIYDYFNGQFFSVDDFSFGFNVLDEDAAADAGTAATGKDKSSTTAVKPKATTSAFGKWKSASADEIKAMKFQLKVDDLKITRRYDRASPVLFQLCSQSVSLKSASLVKRKVVGDDMLQTFLRYDFDELLITHINFQDAEVIKETIQFAFRKVQIQYRTQNADGSLGDTSQMSWSYDAATRVNGPSK